MEIKALIEKVLPYAPSIASALGGPYAAIAMKIINGAFGITDSSNQGILDNLSTDPDLQFKLKQLDAEIAQLKLTTSANDTENARQFELSEEKLGKSHNMPVIITVFLMISFTITLGVLLSPIPVNVTNASLIGSMVGMLTREFIQACRFYIGGDGSET